MSDAAGESARRRSTPRADRTQPRRHGRAGRRRRGDRDRQGGHGHLDTVAKDNTIVQDDIVIPIPAIDRPHDGFEPRRPATHDVNPRTSIASSCAPWSSRNRTTGFHRRPKVPTPVANVERADPTAGGVLMPPQVKTELRRLLCAILVSDFRASENEQGTDTPERTETR